ncbi:MAG: hypothetical protein AAGC95_07150 [Pseudomonadota bacterium]
MDRSIGVRNTSFLSWRLAALASLGFLAACATTAPPPPPEVPSFIDAGRDPIALYVDDVVVEELYIPPLKAPNKEHEFQVSPAAIARDWADGRLQAAGEEGMVRVRILDAAVVEEPLPRTGGFFQRFSDTPDRRLQARLHVEASYDGPYSARVIEIVVTGQVDINQYANLNVTEAQYLRMLKQMSKDFDTALSARVSKNFSELVLEP